MSISNSSKSDHRFTPQP